MNLTLIIQAYNVERYIEECMRSALADAPPNLLEILVVDNGSTDQTAEVAAKFPLVRVLHESAKGPTLARQRALTEAQGDVILSIDADTRVPRGWFAAMQRELQKPGVVCASGPFTFYDFPAWKRACADAYWKTFARLTYAATRYMAAGGNFAAWKVSLNEAGGFGTFDGFYGDDTDLARRMHSVGIVSFSPLCSIETSARRFDAEGMLKTTTVYALNYVWVVAFNRPLTHAYRDIR